VPLVTIPNIEIARVGDWSASTGKWNCTRSQIADAVRAYESGRFRKPILRRGHTDKRYDGDVQGTGDGEPTLGIMRNLRAGNGGDSLFADLLVPQWLAEEMPATYPSRSIEAELGVETKDGERFAMVATGLALLGETMPAIQSLSDVPDYEPEPVEYIAAMAVAASIPVAATWEEDLHPRAGGKFAVKKGAGYKDKGDQAPQVRALQKELIRLGLLDPKSGANGGVDGKFGPATEAAVKAWQKAAGHMATGRVTPALLSTLKDAKKGGDPAKFSAKHNADRKKARKFDPSDERVKADLRPKRAKVKAAAEELVEDLDEGLSVREILPEAVVYASADGLVWVADWDEDDESGVEIGELTPAAVTYTPLAASEAAQAAHRMHAAMLESPRGWDLPIGSSLGALPVDITQMREALGFDEKASDEEILAELKRLKSAAVPATETPKDPSIVEPPVVPAAPEVVQQNTPVGQETKTVSASGDLEARLEAKWEARLAASVGTVQAANATLAAELSKVTGELAARKADEAVTKRETLLASAVSLGKITPADKEHYGRIYDIDPTGTEQVLAARKEYSAVPMQAIGHSGDAPGIDSELEAMSAAMGWGPTNG
jgi:hypothetical protein